MNTLFGVELEQISRRQFMDLVRQDVAALLLLPILKSLRGKVEGGGQQPSHGRILGNKVALHERPSFRSEVLKLYWFDLVLPITDITVGDEEPKYNRIWYQINNEGFVHSGSVQPVDIRFNTPRKEIPAKGLLAEVTVPFTDVLWHPRRPQSVAYRFYYSTTHWVNGSYEDDQGKIWYRIQDDKWGFNYYGNAAHFHLIKPSECQPISPEVPATEKRLEINLSNQVLVAYEESTPVFMTRVATGARFSDGDFRTKPGRYYTNRKRPSRHMAAGDMAARNSYDLPGVPWICYLTQQGVAIHGTYWHNDFGIPRSHGCINVPPIAARWIYRWTLPFVPIDVSSLDKDPATVVEVS